jgi:hypothetical protein
MLALAAVLLLAAGLRFAGLDWGLRHVPHWDERVFVENARVMVLAGDLDHRYYEYPGLFFYLLYPVLRLMPEEALAGPGSYLAARAVVAGFGVLSVALVAVLGRRLLTTEASLAAALLLALSPVDVITAHMVRPDVVLGAFVLLAVLAFRGIGAGWRGDLLSGAAVGAAAAVKFTGLLLAPVYLAARMARPGPHLARLVAASLLALLVAVALTPYALLHHEAYLGGVDVQLGAHYRGGISAPSYLSQVAYYLQAVVSAFGAIGSVLIALGVLSVGRAWRDWLPILVHPALTIAVLATSEIRFQRHLVPATGLLALLAGRGIQVLGRRWGPAAPLAVALAAASPLSAALDYVRGISQPSNQDRALDWTLAHVPPSARIVTTVEGLGLDESRWEVMRRRELDDLTRLLAGDADAAIVHVDEAGLLEGLDGLVRQDLPETRNPHAGRALAALARPPGAPPGTAIPIPRSALRTSRGTSPEALVDGDEGTFWDTGGPQEPGDFLEVRLLVAARIARLELVLGARAAERAGALQVLVSLDGASWSRVAVVPGRPPVERQLAWPRSQVLLIPPVEASGVRLVQAGRRRRPWAVAELRLQGPRP